LQALSEKAQEIEWLLLTEGQQRNVLKVILLSSSF